MEFGNFKFFSTSRLCIEVDVLHEVHERGGEGLGVDGRQKLIGPNLEDVVLASVMSQHTLSVLACVVTVRTEERLLSVLRNYHLQSLGIMPLRHVVLLLSVFVLSHCLKSTEFTGVTGGRHFSPNSLPVRVKEVFR